MHSLQTPHMNYNAVLSKSTKSLDELDKIMYIHIRLYTSTQSVSVRFIIMQFQVTISMNCQSINILERKLRSGPRKKRAAFCLNVSCMFYKY
jgi:hypothetical protein